MKKRFISMMLAVLMLLGCAMTAGTTTAEAAYSTAFQQISSSKPMKTFILSTGNIPCYANSSCTTRGTITAGSSKTAYIAPSDDVYVLQIDTTYFVWAKVSYPVGSKRYQAYIPLSAITSNNSTHQLTTANAKVMTYKRANSNTGSSSMYIDPGDTVYLVATNGSYCQVMYPCSGGWRLAWVTKNNYNACLNKKVSTTPSTSSALPADIYLKQQGDNTCTLAASAMMLRTRAYLSGKSYSSITEANIRSTAWQNGVGLYASWTYVGMSVVRSSVNGISVSTLKSLLNSHPEGIVLFAQGYVYQNGQSKWSKHAVFLTDYSGNTFYCADPSNSYSGVRRTLSSSMLGSWFGTQDGVLDKVTDYWYVKSY